MERLWARGAQTPLYAGIQLYPIFHESCSTSGKKTVPGIGAYRHMTSVGSFEGGSMEAEPDLVNQVEP